MASMAKTYAFSRAIAAFALGGFAVLVVHQPLVALLHVLGFTPITPYSLRATRPWGVPVFLSLTFWGGIWTILIAWILDRLPRGWVYYVSAVGLGRTASNLMTWFVIFPLKGLSPARQARRSGFQCAARQWHLGSSVCGCMVLDIHCSSVDGHESRRALTQSAAIILNVMAVR